MMDPILHSLKYYVHTTYEALEHVKKTSVNERIYKKKKYQYPHVLELHLCIASSSYLSGLLLLTDVSL